MVTSDLSSEAIGKLLNICETKCVRTQASEMVLSSLYWTCQTNASGNGLQILVPDFLHVGHKPSHYLSNASTITASTSQLIKINFEKFNLHQESNRDQFF